MADSYFERKRQEEAAQKGGRLPPGQELTLKFPVLHYGPVPPVNLERWNFRVWGAVEREVRWSWEEFNRLPRVQVTMDLHCVTKWSKLDTLWEGVSVGALVQAGLIRPLPSARFVLQHAEYDFTANLPLSVTLADNFILATHYDGKPLTLDHGFPLRGVIGAIPGRPDLVVPYLWKGAKWLRGLEFLAEDQPGFWEQAGYHNNGDVWKEERYA